MSEVSIERDPDDVTLRWSASEGADLHFHGEEIEIEADEAAKELQEPEQQEPEQRTRGGIWKP